MAATLSLDRFELMWLVEGAVGKSHLRWGIYDMMVNDVWPQLNDNEREFLYTYIKRDISWHFENSTDTTPRDYFYQMLARYNPVNQYRVTLKRGREKSVVEENAYLWNDKYYVGWQRYCAQEYVKKVERKSYRVCTNENCSLKDTCIRYKERNKRFANGTNDKVEFAHQYTGCDLIILESEIENSLRTSDKNVG